METSPDFITRKEFDDYKEARAASDKAINDKLDLILKSQEEVKTFMGYVNVGWGVFRFSFKNASSILYLIGLVAVIVIIIKYGIVAGGKWALKAMGI